MARLEVEILTLFPRDVRGVPRGEHPREGAGERARLQSPSPTSASTRAGKHRVADDAPYGGGAGMVMKPEPLVRAIEAARARLPGARVLLTSPRGARLDQRAREGARRARRSWCSSCGRYEGVDERVRAAVDRRSRSATSSSPEASSPRSASWTRRRGSCRASSATRTSAGAESFAGDAALLEHPHYTRPPEFRGMKVPEVLLRGDHRRIERWRRREALRVTRERRPDSSRRPG